MLPPVQLMLESLQPEDALLAQAFHLLLVALVLPAGRGGSWAFSTLDEALLNEVRPQLGCT